MKYFLATISFLFSYFGAGLILMLVVYIALPAAFDRSLSRYFVELLVNVLAVLAGVYSARVSLRSLEKKKNKAALQNF